MLQRAASNAYSWWWASHIRTKQSKWLEQSLQDMEEKVANALNLVQKDGDSFAKRAEMYYKHRPELIAFIEESVRAYRALAERYDKLSTDLQKANTTIASVFPDQVPYDTDYDDDDNNNNNNNGQKVPKNIGPNPPKAPEPKDFKSFLSNGPKKNQAKKVARSDDHPNHFSKSGLTKEAAVEEIDKLQKDILSLQTMKEFTKSSYENGLAKFSEFENKIIEMQQRVCDLQDEFKVAKVIEDGDARATMAEAALKSCKESLAKLEAKHEKSSHDTRLEHERIQIAKKKLESIKLEYLQEEEEGHKVLENTSLNSTEIKQKELQANIKESIEEVSNKPWTVTEMADSIDKLVNKVISLETMVSSQTALIDRLRFETDDLHTQIQNLEEGKANLMVGAHNFAETFKEMEKKLDGVEDLDMNIENHNNSLEMEFNEAHCNFKHLSENLHSMMPDDEEKSSEPSINYEEIKKGGSPLKLENSSNDGSEFHNQGNVERDTLNPFLKEQAEEKEISCMNDEHEKNGMVINEKIEVETGEKKEDSNKIGKDDGNFVNDEFFQPKKLEEEVNDERNWQELLLGSLDDKEKVLLQEYTTILRKYKAMKKEMVEEEQKNQGTVVEMKLQVQDLKTLLAKRDSEIQQMKRNLKLLQQNGDEDDKEEVIHEEDDIKSIVIDKSQLFSEIEEKLRYDIDAILDENLDFWLRFSSTFQQLQKFKKEVEDLQQEIIKVKSKETEEKTSIKSEINALYKHLKEIQNELIIWLELSALLKIELQRRCSSLSNIQEKITTALREGVEEEEIKFSTHQAAKFQGEVSNMQQENNKVNKELQAGLDHVTMLQAETEKILRKLEQDFGLSDQKQPRLSNRPHVPLRSFIFGVKSKKQKPSILACINPHKKLTASDSGIF